VDNTGVLVLHDIHVYNCCLFIIKTEIFIEAKRCVVTGNPYMHKAAVAQHQAVIVLTLR
jgi:hypothetical protein